jgi:hypothetical protein
MGHTYAAVADGVAACLPEGDGISVGWVVRCGVDLGAPRVTSPEKGVADFASRYFAGLALNFSAHPAQQK